MRRGRIFKRCGRCTHVIASERKACDGCGYRGFSWAVRVDVAPRGAPRRQRFKQGFATKADALAWLNEVQDRAATGRLVEPSKATVAQYLAAWLASVRPPAIRPSTWESYRIAVERYVVPRIGDVQLQALARADVRALYAELASSGRVRGEGGLSAKSVHNVAACLRVSLARAVEDGLLVTNPAERAHRLPREQAERETWTPAELARFLAHVGGDRLYALWRLAAYSGARRGELVALRWPSVDLRGGTVTIERTRVKGEGGRVTEGGPKTARGRRTLDVDPETALILREHRKAQVEERLEWGAAYQDLGYCFAREDGTPYHPDAISERFEALCRRAGVRAIGMHAALRHLHGSLMLRAGVPLHVVSRRLGHANESFTAHVYAHVLPQQGADAARAFAAALESRPRQGAEA